jgi:hypothetical protein
MNTCPFGIEELNDVRFWVDQFTFYSRNLNKYCVRFSLLDRKKQRVISEVFVSVSKLTTNETEELKAVLYKFHQDRDLYLQNDKF